MLGRSSTHHPPEPHRLSEYLCRKSLELRVSNLSLLQETMIRESRFKREWQFCRHPLNHTAMINTNHTLKGTLPVLLVSIVFVNYWLISPSSWWNFLHLLVIRVLDTESSKCDLIRQMRVKYAIALPIHLTKRKANMTLNFNSTFGVRQRRNQISYRDLPCIWLSQTFQ